MRKSTERGRGLPFDESAEVRAPAPAVTPATNTPAHERESSGRARSLSLLRPLVFLDCEATGTDPASDRIVELAMVRVEPPGERTRWVRRIHPGIPIPKEATAVHGISDADVRDCPAFSALAREISDFLRGADLAGFNVAGYDVPLLAAEMRRAGVETPADDARIVDAMTIFHRRERRDLSAAVRLYLGREHSGVV